MVATGATHAQSVWCLVVTHDKLELGIHRRECYFVPAVQYAAYLMQTNVYK